MSEQIEWLKNRLAMLQLPADQQDQRDKWLAECGMPDAPPLPTEGMVLVPRRPTEDMMQAGLYQSSHDAEYADVFSAWVDMVAVFEGRGSPDDKPAEAPPSDGIAPPRSSIDVHAEIVGELQEQINALEAQLQDRGRRTEAAEAREAKLREALEPFARMTELPNPGYVRREMVLDARAALATKEG